MVKCHFCHRDAKERPKESCTSIFHWQIWGDAGLTEMPDRKDEFSDDIVKFMPLNSGSHHEYALAMKMVESRHSKASLVALVNWLLVRLRDKQ